MPSQATYFPVLSSFKIKFMDHSYIPKCTVIVVSECIIWLQEFRRGSSSYLGINCIIGKFKYKDQYIYLDFKICVGNFAYC